MKRKQVLIVLAAALAILFFSLAFAAESVIRVSLQPCLQALPSWWAAQAQQGKADSVPFKLQLYPSGAPQNEALAANEWDVGTTGIPAALMAVLRYDAKIIGVSNDESDATDIWVRADSPMLKTKGAVPGYPDIYGTPEDWKGKKILVTTISTAHYVVFSTLKALGLSEKDVQIVNIEQAQAITAFNAGEGDMVCVWAPFTFSAESKGWVKVSSGRAAKVGLCGVLIANKAYAAKEPGQVSKWLRHYLEKVDMTCSDPKGSEPTLSSFYADYCGLMLPKNVIGKDFEIHPLFPMDRQLEAMRDPAQLAAWADGLVNFFKEKGTLKEKDVEALRKKNFGIDPSFMASLKN